ncbi:ATP-grasp domain-containing protein [Amycolatopsis rhizosphaerae]|uniref:ATP-grasp domain-containing protein n=1 Tax=Amycolatopsis rhizosphaerae TaxID=2053003 RepID=A0A558BKR8_9PSEU|nr:ATP-grasp domain-containing protein [Amycolatopsis rhizosphaerae]TVT37090.1 ATP-grasp domain-containing protein [Amycolatopsis rhizosphaerae]
MRPLVLLVGIVFEGYRGYLLDSIGSVADVWLLAEAEPAPSVAEKLAGHTVVDVFDTPALVAAAREVAGRRRVTGVLSWDELKMSGTAHVARALGLPGVGPDVVDRCRDKHRTRAALAAAGVPQPASEVVSTAAEATAAADRIGYPVVLKPRDLGASMGVIRVGSRQDLADGYAHARAARVGPVPYRSDGVLVEEFVDGPEVSVDSWVSAGRSHPLFTAHKTTGYPPYFEEIGHVVDGREPGDPDLYRVVAAAHEALGFDHGMTHVELRLARDGWRVIEVNCRLGGDLIPMLGRAATGVDAGVVAARLACGLEPDPRPGRDRAAAVRFLYPHASCQVDRVEIDTSRLPAAIELAAGLVQPGTTISPPPAGHVWGRYAVLVAVSGTPEGCAAALDAAEPAVLLHTRTGTPESSTVGHLADNYKKQ